MVNLCVFNIKVKKVLTTKFELKLLTDSIYIIARTIFATTTAPYCVKHTHTQRVSY